MARTWGLRKIINRLRRKLLRKNRAAKNKAATKENDAPYNHLEPVEWMPTDNSLQSTNSTAEFQISNNDVRETNTTDATSTDVEQPIPPANTSVEEVDIGEELWALPGKAPIPTDDNHDKNFVNRPRSFFKMNSNAVDITEAPCNWNDLEGNDTVILSNLSWTPTAIWGRVLVANLSYEKKISIRISTDDWESYSDHPAIYELSSSEGTKDSFLFKIKISSLNAELAVRYCFCSGEAWDNNCNMNYKLHCIQ